MNKMTETREVICVNLPWDLPKGYTGVRAGSRWPHTRKESEQLVDEYPFPFLLAYTTAVLQEAGIPTLLLDCLAENIKTEDFLKIVKTVSPKFIIAEIATPSIDNDLRILKLVREQVDVTTILTGTHATALGKDLLKENDWVDFVLKGEYELSSLALIKSLGDGTSLEQTRGLIYRKNSLIHENDYGEPSDLDELPLPAREQLNMENYNENFCLQTPNVTLISSRGCPMSCTFCIEPVFYRTYRLRSPELVMDEVAYLLRKYRPREFYFDDSSFTVNRTHVRAICDLILSRGINIAWSVMGDVRVDQTTLRVMKRAGLVGIKFGVETADTQNLTNIKKSHSLLQVREFVDSCKKLGIRTHATYTFGCPGETTDSIEKTLEFAVSLDTDTAQFSCLTPYPGTPLYEEARERGWLRTRDFAEFDGLRSSVLAYENLSSKQIEKAVQEGKKRILRNILVRHPRLAGKAAMNVVTRQGLRTFVRRCANLLQLIR